MSPCTKNMSLCTKNTSPCTFYLNSKEQKNHFYLKEILELPKEKLNQTKNREKI